LEQIGTETIARLNKVKPQPGTVKPRPGTVKPRPGTVKPATVIEVTPELHDSILNETPHGRKRLELWKAQHGPKGPFPRQFVVNVMAQQFDHFLNQPQIPQVFRSAVRKLLDKVRLPARCFLIQQLSLVSVVSLLSL
jgi:hypothetical protein